MNKPDDSSRSAANAPSADGAATRGEPARSALGRAPDERWFTAGALALVWLGALAALWSVLARQSPASPYLVRGVYELIEGLSLRLWIIAALTLVSAALARRGALFASKNATRAWLVFALWSAGVTLQSTSMAWSAATGAMAVQVRDSGQRGHTALVARWLGGLCLLGSLALAQRAILRGASEPVHN